MEHNPGIARVDAAAPRLRGIGEVGLGAAIVSSSRTGKTRYKFSPETKGALLYSVDGGWGPVVSVADTR